MISLIIEINILVLSLFNYINNNDNILFLNRRLSPIPKGIGRHRKVLRAIENGLYPSCFPVNFDFEF